MIAAQILIGTGLVVLTTLIHSGVTLPALAVLHRLASAHWGMRSRWRRVCFVAGLVLAMFAATLLEVTTWAASYLWLGAIGDLETALYFSMTAFTTLGFGDVVLSQEWRLLSSIEAANGIVLFGWTTGLVIVFIQRMVRILES